ncbi:hypothetical protein DWX81_16095 [Roseburia inulinivorans]|uniref:Transposase IS204/IS1001/IS1096/IS1165 DDE domain-containing protein n=1 Tax=Roseburia inulinivorans TaxID=360807 RepID=A0A414LYF1_9FIRM|nr:hypothetical protein DWX81_16095 [Roseburia inulinivorans]RHF00012.1 hypothetical protein DW707_02055 [Roseburia inulinivorans]
MESINRKLKDLKRLGRDFRNFEHFRNRFPYATGCATETGLRLNTSTNISKNYGISWISTESPIRKNTN